MREILFRGKRTDNGEWVYGYYVCLNGKSHRIYTGYAETDCGSYYPDFYEVVPKSICEYTGLTDKNGIRIFEGDICQTKGYKLIDETPFVIVWNDFYSGWYWEDVKNANDTDMLTKSVAELTEVIGNIHDNPELLKIE